MYVDILILSQLMHEQKHGYEIRKGAEKILGYIYKINNNSLYPVLRQFEEMGAIEKHIEVQEGKPNRHVYHITPLGKEILIDLIKDYTPEIASNDYEFYTRVGLFDLIDGQSRRTILKTRQTALTQIHSHLDQIGQRDSLQTQHFFAAQVIDMMKRQRQLEAAWIDEMLQEGI